MSITARVLILSSDESLRDEAKIAFESLGGDGPRFRFVSNKGGVGKSTRATNTGVAIARRGKQSVLLNDGSIQMGVAAALLDLTPNATLTDLARESERFDPTMIRQTAAVHSSGLHLLAAPADAVEAMEIDDVLMARIITMARQTYDIVIVDTFPMFDRIVIAALDLSDRVYVVLENVVPTLLGGVKLLGVLERIGYPGYSPIHHSQSTATCSGQLVNKRCGGTHAARYRSCVTV